MATGRERLRQATSQLAGVDDIIQVQRPPRMPRGGEVLVNPGPPSRAGEIDTKENTYAADFGEMLLNRLGLSSPRQIAATKANQMALHEQNEAMKSDFFNRAERQVQRGLAGPELDKLHKAMSKYDEYAHLLDAPNPEVAAYARKSLEEGMATLDEIDAAYAARYDDARKGHETRINARIESARETIASFNEPEAALIAEIKAGRGNVPLPATLKNMVFEVIGGGSFGQRAIQQAGIVPMADIAYDSTEVWNANNLLAQMQAVKKAAMLSDQAMLGDDILAAQSQGFAVPNKDGKLSANELAVTLLGAPTTEKVQLPANIPPGGQVSRAGPEAIKPAVESNVAIFRELVKEGLPAVGELLGEGFNAAIDAAKNALGFGPQPDPKKPTPRPGVNQ